MTTIDIVPAPPGKPTGATQTGIARFTDDIEADHADLKAAGVDVDAKVNRMGDPLAPICWLREPDANILIIVENG